MSNFMIPATITTDVPDFNFNNSLHRVWHVQNLAGFWFRAAGERNGAGAVATSHSIPYVQVLAECKERKLHEVKLRELKPTT